MDFTDKNLEHAKNYIKANLNLSNKDLVNDLKEIFDYEMDEIELVFCLFFEERNFEVSKENNYFKNCDDFSSYKDRY